MKWYRARKGKFPFSFFIFLTQCHEFPALKFKNFYVFIIPLPLKVTLFSKSCYLTVYIKFDYETGWFGRFSTKRDVSRTITTANMELFVELVSSFQSLPNFKKNPHIASMGVLKVSLEYYNIFLNLCRWSN